jgi:aminoglycoside 2'-N-acetyltransferase I
VARGRDDTTVTALRIRTLPTDELEPEEMDALTRMCEAAFRRPFAPVWERVGPGLHVVGEVGGVVVAHAMVIDRQLYLGHEPDQALDVGYVENVATDPAHQGSGFGTAVMQEAARVIREEYALGALATTTHGFYSRLGWERWGGPTYTRTPDGQRVRSARDDGHVMILRTPRTPAALDLAGAIAVDWRAGEPW